MYFEDARAPIIIQPAYDQDSLRRHDVSLNVEGSTARYRFREFFRCFRLGTIFPYRDALIRHWNRGEYFVEVNVTHLDQYDTALYNSLKSQPNDIIPLFEAAAKDSLKLFLTEQSAEDAKWITVPDFQVILKSEELTQPIRTLTAEHVNQLIKVSGIVISCSRIRSKTTLVSAKCSKCGTIEVHIYLY